MSTLPEGSPIAHVCHLEAVRHQMVRTVLEIRAVCERAHESSGNGTAVVSANNAQRLLSAAVKDLVELDDRLHDVRTGKAQHNLAAPPYTDVHELLAAAR